MKFDYQIILSGGVKFRPYPRIYSKEEALEYFSKSPSFNKLVETFELE